jgi:hypothetical protein
MVNKRGQLKIQQMVMMILAVTLFFVLAGMLILVFTLSNLKQKATQTQADNARLLVSKIADSPEFSCGDSFGTGLSSCIDGDKVINLKSLIGDYGNGKFWGVSGLEIRKIYPKNNGTICTGGNFPNCDRMILIPQTNGTGVSNFVSLCYLKSEQGNPYVKCDLAEAIVTYSGA